MRARPAPTIGSSAILFREPPPRPRVYARWPIAKHEQGRRPPRRPPAVPRHREHTAPRPARHLAASRRPRVCSVTPRRRAGAPAGGAGGWEMCTCVGACGPAGLLAPPRPHAPSGSCLRASARGRAFPPLDVQGPSSPPAEAGLTRPRPPPPSSACPPSSPPPAPPPRPPTPRWPSCPPRTPP